MLLLLLLFYFIASLHFSCIVDNNNFSRIYNKPLSVDNINVSSEHFKFKDDRTLEKSANEKVMWRIIQLLGQCNAAAAALRYFLCRERLIRMNLRLILV